MNKGMQRYLDSLPPGSVKPADPEIVAEYERQMREETIPKIERAIKAQRRAAHFCCLGIPDPLAIVDGTATAAANGDLPVPLRTAKRGPKASPRSYHDPRD